MEKEFVTYKQALILKKLGFDEPCFGWFVSEVYGLELGQVVKSNLIKDGVLAPTFSQAFRWFRDNYGMFHNIDKIFSDEFGYIITNEKDEPLNDFDFNTWEEAELACLDKLIELIEKI